MSQQNQRVKVAFANGAIHRLVEKGIDPNNFVKVAYESQNPNLVKIANIILEADNLVKTAEDTAVIGRPQANNLAAGDNTQRATAILSGEAGGGGGTQVSPEVPGRAITSGNTQIGGTQVSPEVPARANTSGLPRAQGPALTGGIEDHFRGIRGAISRNPRLALGGLLGTGAIAGAGGVGAMDSGTTGNRFQDAVNRSPIPHEFDTKRNYQNWLG